MHPQTGPEAKSMTEPLHPSAGEAPRSPSAAQVEAAARALWKIGNARIGERPWESVCAHYIAEATAALEAAYAADPRLRALVAALRAIDEHAKRIVEVRGDGVRVAAAETVRMCVRDIRARARAALAALEMGD